MGCEAYRESQARRRQKATTPSPVRNLGTAARHASQVASHAPRRPAYRRPLLPPTPPGGGARRGSMTVIRACVTAAY